MTIQDDEEKQIRNQYHRKGPRPSIDVEGYLMPLPSSRPPSRRGSLQKVEVTKKQPPKKSYSVTDIDYGRVPKITKGAASLDNASLHRSTTSSNEDCDRTSEFRKQKSNGSLTNTSLKAPLIRTHSPEDSPPNITPMTPPNNVKKLIQSPKTGNPQKRTLLVCAQTTSQDSMGSMAPRLSIISERNVEASLSENED